MAIRCELGWLCGGKCALLLTRDALPPRDPSAQIRSLANPGDVFSRIMNLMLDLAASGLVHCDCNEFNIIVSDSERVTLIDFPQMVSASHENAGR